MAPSADRLAGTAWPGWPTAGGRSDSGTWIGASIFWAGAAPADPLAEPADEEPGWGCWPAEPAAGRIGLGSGDVGRFGVVGRAGAGTLGRVGVAGRAGAGAVVASGVAGRDGAGATSGVVAEDATAEPVDVACPGPVDSEVRAACLPGLAGASVDPAAESDPVRAAGAADAPDFFGTVVSGSGAACAPPEWPTRRESARVSPLADQSPDARPAAGANPAALSAGAGAPAVVAAVDAAGPVAAPDSATAPFDRSAPARAAGDTTFASLGAADAGPAPSPATAADSPGGRGATFLPASWLGTVSFGVTALARVGTA